MVNMRRLRLVLFLLVVSAAEADTVTGRDSSSWNGRVTISDGVLTLVASFRNGKVIMLTFGTYYVRSIQFNPMVYNPGSEPVWSKNSICMNLRTMTTEGEVAQTAA
jgi:hypothetical protein